MPNLKGQERLAVIKVVGVGGVGTNAINRMVEANVRGVEDCINLDAMVFEKLKELEPYWKKVILVCATT